MMDMECAPFTPGSITATTTPRSSVTPRGCLLAGINVALKFSLSGAYLPLHSIFCEVAALPRRNGFEARTTGYPKEKKKTKETVRLAGFILPVAAEFQRAVHPHLLV